MPSMQSIELRQVHLSWMFLQLSTEDLWLFCLIPQRYIEGILPNKSIEAIGMGFSRVASYLVPLNRTTP